MYSMHLEGPGQMFHPEVTANIRPKCLFIGGNARKAVNEHRADYVPAFFHEIPGLFRSKAIPLDVAFVSVSPPDRHGYCSLGVSVDCSLAALQSAKVVVAQINRHMPRTHGDGLLHVSEIDIMVEGDVPLPTHNAEPLTDVERSIGKHVASLVPDGATLQMGIGNIPNAVLSELVDHRDLGVHTELFNDGVIDLVERGVVTNRCKRTHPNRLVSTFLVGSDRLYKFVDDNPGVAVLDVAYVNEPSIIARNPSVHAINSAIEVDITGQVCADSIGTMFFSGVGGQMDFMRGAALSQGGKPIIALPSVTSKGESRIVPFLKQGAGVVTTRAHVHYVVTEHGIAYLHGKSIRERADELVRIAHPSHRPALHDEVKKRFG